MAINKKLIHFKKKEDFNKKKLSTNEANTQYRIGLTDTITIGEPEIKYQSIVFIKNTKEIWTHDQIYPCPYTEQEILDMIKDVTPTKEMIESLLTGDITSHTHNTLYAAKSHTHNYAGSTTAGGAANSVKSSLVISVNSGTQEGVNRYTFNGSANKTVNLKAGDNIALESNGNTITINSTASSSGGSTLPEPTLENQILVSLQSTSTQNGDISTQADLGLSTLTPTWVNFETELNKFSASIPNPTQSGQTLTTATKNGKIVPIWEDSYDEDSYGITYPASNGLRKSQLTTKLGTEQLLNKMPVQSGMKGCVYNPKTKKLVYWLDPDNWNYIDGITQEMNTVLYSDGSGTSQLPVYRNAGYWGSYYGEEIIESAGIVLCNSRGGIINTDDKFEAGVDKKNKTYYVRILLDSTNPGLSQLKQRITKQPERLQISMCDLSDLQKGTPVLSDLNQLVWKGNNTWDTKENGVDKGVIITSASFATTSEGQILIVKIQDSYLTEDLTLDIFTIQFAEYFNCNSEEYQRAFIRLKSDLSGYDGEVMVWVPPFQLRNEPGQIRIKEASSTKYDQYDQIKGFLVSAYPLSIVRSNPNDGGYLSTIGTYPCLASVCNDKAYCRGGSDNATMDQWLTSSKYLNSTDYSMTQFTQLRKPITAINRAQARNWCKYSNIELIDFEHVMLVNILALIEGSGAYKNQSGFVFNGATPKYLIGEMNEYGNNTAVKQMEVFKNAVTPDDITSGNVSSKVCSDDIYKYRGIENFWGDSLIITDKVLAYSTSSSSMTLYYNPKSNSYDSTSGYSNNITYPKGITSYKLTYGDFKQISGSSHSLFPNNVHNTASEQTIEWSTGTNNVTVGYCNSVNNNMIDIRCSDAVTSAPSNTNFTSVYRSMIILDKEPSL